MEKKRPISMPELAKPLSSKSSEDLPPFLPPRKPSKGSRPPPATTSAERPISPSSWTSSSRPDPLPSIPDDEPIDELETHFGDGVSAQASDSEWSRSLDTPLRNPRLHALRTGEARRSMVSQIPRRLSTRRSSSLRLHRRASEDDVLLNVHPSLLAPAKSVPILRVEQPRPHSHPPARGLSRARSTLLCGDDDDLWKPSPLPDLSRVYSPPATPRPSPSFNRLSSLDHLMTYREEVNQWKRASSLQLPNAVLSEDGEIADPESHRELVVEQVAEARISDASEKTTTPSMHESISPAPSLKNQSKFRSFTAEVGFCFTIAMTQFLAEYLISGFALALPDLIGRTNVVELGPGTLGLFWPASLLSLALSAMLLTFARLADIYGGYGMFMMGLLWLAVWTLIPGFFASVIILDVARAMQGLALAAFMPSTFVMVSTFYENGPRKNFVLGLYSGCAPLGFFAGILTAGALPRASVHWYLWIASILAFVTTVTAYLSVPHDWTDRKQLGLKMDWLGSFLIIASLVQISYSLAYEPGANMLDRARDGFSFPAVYGPFTAGVVCLLAAVYVEGWYADCPLLPFDFFRPKSTIAICIAGLCFYASYGVWLYESAEFFGSVTGVTTHPLGLRGIQLAVWYTPTAVAGLVLCVVGASLMHIVPMKVLLLVSGVAWVGAPLLLALCPLPVNYWAFVLPSMLCATLGIDLTFTISLVYFSSVQPKRYQGLCGAVCSILVNLAMSFSLPISEIIEAKASSSFPCSNREGRVVWLACQNHSTNFSYRAMFFYAAGSAGLGLIICILFVRFPLSAVRERQPDEERPRETSSEASTLVDGSNGREGEV